MRSDISNMSALITGLVGSVTGLAVDELLLATRGLSSVARARQVAMYLAHTSCGLSLSEVGKMFSRDKSTVAHAVHQIEDLRDDNEFDDWLGDLETALQTVTEMTPRTHHVLRGVWRPASVEAVLERTA